MKVYVEYKPEDCINCPCFDKEYEVCKLIKNKHIVELYKEGQDGYLLYRPINKTNSKKMKCPLIHISKCENQKVIDCLKEAKREFETYYADNIWNYPEWIDQKIRELNEVTNETIHNNRQ